MWGGNGSGVLQPKENTLEGEPVLQKEKNRHPQKIRGGGKKRNFGELPQGTNTANLFVGSLEKTG